MIKRFVFVLMIFCSFAFLCASIRAEDGKKILFIHVTGDTGKNEIDNVQRVDSWVALRLKELTGSTIAYSSMIFPACGSTAESNETDIRLLKNEVFPKNDKIVIEIVMRYYGDVYKWTKEGSYPADVVALFNVAGDLVATIVSEFKTLYPNSQIEGFAISIGSNVLLNAIEKGAKDFDNLLLVVPPIVDESNFNRLLLNNGYNDKKVQVITVNDDPAAPLNLQGGEDSAFTLIKKVD